MRHIDLDDVIIKIYSRQKIIIELVYRFIFLQRSRQHIWKNIVNIWILNEEFIKRNQWRFIGTDFIYLHAAINCDNWQNAHWVLICDNHLNILLSCNTIALRAKIKYPSFKDTILKNDDSERFFSI